MTECKDPLAAELPGLLQRHYDSLRSDSGLSIEIIQERGYRSMLGRKELGDLGFTPAQQRPPGLLVPVWAPDGSNPVNCYRPDNPRQPRDGKPLKYEFPKGAYVRLDVPPRCRAAIADPKVPLWLTEGSKKADALATHGLTAGDLLGVWNFKGKNKFGGVTFLADFDYIALNGRIVNIVFDSDIMSKHQVRAALERLTEHLQRKGAIVNAVYLPAGPDGKKVGVDDFLLVHSVADLEALVVLPRPTPKPAPPVYELLDDAPPTLSRPLDLVGGRAYATTWLWVARTVTERLAKDGQIERLDPPKVEKSREMFIVRDDGAVFGLGEKPVSDLGFHVQMHEPPADDKLWRAAAVKAYRRRQRPDFSDVFRRLVSVYDRFIDFNQSLADQSTMCEFSACASLVTWFTPAFAVLPYIWPTGDRGSGKTKWGICWAMTSYLGEIVLSSGSFPAIRDLADYGASLMFDDAEILSDPRKCDPNKRELLLAGNRRGARIPVKEPDPNGGWKIRWVNAYTPRVFTAIRTPDPVLASRTIAIPLVRTPDTQRGNRDPMDTARWPCDYRQLSDDLWAVALGLLPEAERGWAAFDSELSATGREFEPWRAILSVARLVERHGVAGLEKRMRDLSAASRSEKSEIFGEDHTILVIKALLQLADIKNISDVTDDCSGQVVVSASDVSQAVGEVIASEGEGDGEEQEISWATPRKVGRILSRLRIRQDRSMDRNRVRSRTISKRDLLGLARAYGLFPHSDTGGCSSPESSEESPKSDVLNGHNVRNVRSRSLSTEPRKPCDCCRGERFWRKVGGAEWICERCHPHSPELVDGWCGSA